ncbi:MAG: methyltransferase domain-containing protein [Candidatus Pacebacteria bacterium]|nr:methyltransferase domain-containing protein [Candidatus Paceibacterota bacterium]
MDKKNNLTSWGGVSEWYDNYLETDKDSYQEKVIAPNILRILNIKKGDVLLDLACGQGFFSRKFSAQGANVTGVDISRELITVAKKHSENISYNISPAHKLPFIKNNTVDAVTIILAIQNIENMQEVFNEVSRVMKKTGRLVLVVNHPAFRIPKESSWGFDPASGTQYRRVDSYLSQSKTKISMHPSKKDSTQTVSYHRSLQDFFKALGKSGFAVTKFEEWISHKKSEKGPRQKAEDTARKEIPIFLAIEAKNL